MSKLLDKLDKAGQPAPRRMGFVSSSTYAPVPPMILVVRLDASAGKSVAGAVGSADCVIVKADGAEQAKAPEGLPESGVWGVQAPGIKVVEVSGLGEKGSDFMVLDAESSQGALLNEENVTKVLSVSTSIEEAYLRILEDVPIDCLLIEHEANGDLMISDLMTLRSILTAVSKPCLVQVRPGLTDGDLSALRHVGAMGVVVDVKSKKEASELPRLREAIDALPPREEDERRQVESLGAHMGHSAAPHIHDDDLDD